jgi:putative redox protein
MPKPPTVANLHWQRDLVFVAESAGQTMTVDGNSKAGPSPVQALAFALASCMATDVVFLLTKGRHQFSGLRAHLTADRAQEDPHRFVRVKLRFAVKGAITGDAVDRAISLSREKYCSVWHSMRQDIDFQVTWDREH